MTKPAKIGDFMAPFKCDICNKHFLYQTTYTIHMEQHKTGQKVNIDFKHCPKCRKKFSTNSLLHRHLKRVHRMHHWFQCRACGKPWPTQESLDKHMQKAHHSSGEGDKKDTENDDEKDVDTKNGEEASAGAMKNDFTNFMRFSIFGCTPMSRLEEFNRENEQQSNLQGTKDDEKSFMPQYAENAIENRSSQNASNSQETNIKRDASRELSVIKKEPADPPDNECQITPKLLSDVLEREEAKNTRKRARPIPDINPPTSLAKRSKRATVNDTRAPPKTSLNSIVSDLRLKLPFTAHKFSASSPHSSVDSHESTENTNGTRTPSVTIPSLLNTAKGKATPNTTLHNIFRTRKMTPAKLMCAICQECFGASETKMPVPSRGAPLTLQAICPECFLAEAKRQSSGCSTVTATAVSRIPQLQEDATMRESQHSALANRMISKAQQMRNQGHMMPSYTKNILNQLASTKPVRTRDSSPQPYTQQSTLKSFMESVGAP